MTKQKLGTNQKKWIEALRSGKYKQGDSVLRDFNDNFCCLGVAHDIFPNEDYEENWTLDGPGHIRDELDCYCADGEWEVASNRIVELLGLKNMVGTPITTELPNEEYALELTQYNDGGASFEEIADILETYPEVYFTEPK